MTLRLLNTLAVTLFCFLFYSIKAQEQLNYKADVKGPVVNVFDSPDLDVAGARKTYKAKQWVEFEAGAVFKARDTSLEAISEVVAIWYIAIYNKKTKTYSLLEEAITHVNVPIGEPVYFSSYLSPASLKALLGKVDERSVKAVGLELEIDGAIIAVESFKEKQGWWKSESLKTDAAVKLLNKNQTPFRFYWYDRYAELEAK